MSLSDRIRPNCEAAPWVLQEIVALENELDCANAFHRVALKERDFEREKNRNLERQRDELLAALRLAAEINPFGSVENARARDAALAAIE